MCHLINNSCSQVGIKLLFTKLSHMSVVLSQITNMPVQIRYSSATFQTDHIGKVIFAAPFFFFLFFTLPTVSQGFSVLSLWMVLKRKTRRQSSRSVLCPTISCRVCCYFAEGLWEVLAPRGQLSAPPSSCFDRYPTFTQTFCLFHVN